MRPTFRMAVVDGVKMVVVNGRTLLERRAVQEQIAALDDQIARRLPALRAGLDAQELLSAAQARIDDQLAEASAIKRELETLEKELG